MVISATVQVGKLRQVPNGSEKPEPWGTLRVSLGMLGCPQQPGTSANQTTWLQSKLSCTGCVTLDNVLSLSATLYLAIKWG